MTGQAHSTGQPPPTFSFDTRIRLFLSLSLSRALSLFHFSVANISKAPVSLQGQQAAQGMVAFYGSGLDSLPRHKQKMNLFY